MAASLILVVVCGGIVEEMFSRGHIIRSVSHMLGSGALAVAGILSAALFAVAPRYQGEVGILYSVGASSLCVVLFVLTNRWPVCALRQLARLIRWASHWKCIFFINGTSKPKFLMLV